MYSRTFSYSNSPAQNDLPLPDRTLFLLLYSPSRRRHHIDSINSPVSSIFIMPHPPQTPWQRRLRRLVFLASTASTFYLISSYVLDRIREGRVRAQKERRERDLCVYIVKLI